MIKHVSFMDETLDVKIWNFTEFIIIMIETKSKIQALQTFLSKIKIFI